MTFRLLLSGHDTIECAYYLAPELGCLLDYERQAAEKKAPRQSKSRNSKAIKLGSESFCWPDTPRVGIDNFRWHDLRHTWASWHVQAKPPLHVLQELGGWESAEMVRRYAHMSADHLAPYADRLCALRGGSVPRLMGAPEHGTFTAQSQKEKGLA